MVNIYYYHSPVGVLKIEATDERLLSLSFVEEECEVNENKSKSLMIEKTTNQLDEYFAGKREKFDLPMEVTGTEFQKKVLKEVQNISYGETASYKEVAKMIGNEKASRAIGNANNKNKLLLVIPCHRVIGANGKLVGYAGGLHRKEWLLNHEKEMDKDEK